MILVIANQKGGVGKTTTAINLASALANKNLKTLIVDMDPQANTTISFLNNEKVKKSIYDVLIPGGCPIEEVIHPTNQFDLKLIPSNISLAKFETMVAGELDAHFRLKDALAPIVDSFDYIIIDTPPVGLVTDAQVLSQITDGSIFVVSSGKSVKEDTIKSKELIRQVGGNIVGFVLNNVKYSSTYKKYSYYYFKWKNFGKIFKRIS